MEVEGPRRVAEGVEGGAYPQGEGAEEEGAEEEGEEAFYLTSLK